MKSILVILLLILIGCNDSESPNEPPHTYDAKEIWPLAVGNYWQFQKTNYAWPSPPTTYEIRIEKDTIIENERHFVFHDYSNSNVREIHSYINRSDGLHYLLYKIDSNRIEDRFMQKYPCSEGETFNKLNEDNVTIVANTNLDVTFQNSKLKAILYVRSGIDTTYGENYYFTIDSMTVIPGLGMIHHKGYRGKHKIDSMELAIESVLIDYKIN